MRDTERITGKRKRYEYEGLGESSEEAARRKRARTTRCPGDEDGAGENPSPPLLGPRDRRSELWADSVARLKRGELSSYEWKIVNDLLAEVKAGGVRNPDTSIPPPQAGTPSLLSLIKLAMTESQLATIMAPSSSQAQCLRIQQPEIAPSVPLHMEDLISETDRHRRVESWMQDPEVIASFAAALEGTLTNSTWDSTPQQRYATDSQSTTTAGQPGVATGALGYALDWTVQSTPDAQSSSRSLQGTTLEEQPRVQQVPADVPGQAPAPSPSGTALQSPAPGVSGQLPGLAPPLAAVGQTDAATGESLSHSHAGQTLATATAMGMPLLPNAWCSACRHNVGRVEVLPTQHSCLCKPCETMGRECPVCASAPPAAGQGEV